MQEELYSYFTLDPKKVFRFLIVLALFFATFVVFKLLARPSVFQNTLGKVTHTYSRDTAVKTNVWKVNEPYYYRNQQNMLSWDASLYNDIRYHYYDNREGQTYAFFPLFPLIWKYLHIDIEFIALFNYLLFGFSIMILSSIFLNKDKLSETESTIVFALSLTLPMTVVYYLPYAEAVYTLTFSLAVWGLVKNKYWVYFIFMALFAMSRPIFMNVGLSLLFIDVFYFIRHRSVPHFLKQLLLKIAPLVLGTAAVFYMYYLNSGNFFKYFDVIEKYWHVRLAFPSGISDWSIEGFGMNVFVIFFVVMLSAVLLIGGFLKLVKSEGKGDPSAFSMKNTEHLKEYFFNVSLLHFCGLFATVLFLQNGSLNGLCRYVCASPFFFIFLFYLFSEYGQVQLKRVLTFFLPALVLSFFMLVGFSKYEPALNFSDSGYFTLLLSFAYLFFMGRMKPALRTGLLVVILIYNITWITYLYNMYLCNAWIYT